MIVDHLLGVSNTARPKYVATGKEIGSNGSWPANVSFNFTGMKKPFPDYEVEGNTI